ncbi:siderophore-interacting protein [Phenylobacterium sp.]|uniref:siderophore-interacting protein n=1 Tax=Phenylobacterium sp. TaxID=1871053 RepID=UPI00301D3F1B
MKPEIRPYRLFDVTLLRREALTPHLSRLTFTGPQVGEMTTHAPDQRIKMFFPHGEGEAETLPDVATWYALYKAMPAATRPAMRTYTIRAVRPEAREVDIDFVMHGDEGPASRWAARSKPGDRLQMTAPDARYSGEVGGYEWKPPAGVRHVLLIADETALPALAGILEGLAEAPSPPAVQAFVEVPEAADILELPHWPGLDLVWMPRDAGDAALGGMAAAVQQARLPALAEAGAGTALPEVDVDAQVLWDRAAPLDGSFYAWVAGEAGAVLAIRKHLVKERGLDRRTLNLMGYWRRGIALDEVA